jgi:hypothetical protein
VVEGLSSAVTRGAAVPLEPKGVPVGRELKFGTARIAPKMVLFPSFVDASTPIPSTCDGEFRTK